MAVSEARIAFCSWSVQPTGVDDLIGKAKAIGVQRVQLAIDPLRTDGGPGQAWAEAKDKLADAGLTFAGGMFAAVGEDYSSIEAIHRTGGIVPDETWPSTWDNFQRMVPIAQSLGLDYISFHAGFIPEQGDPVFDKVAGRLQQVADLCRDAGLRVGLETGQEAAATLKAFLQAAARQNLGVNFDPANMILYGSGEPTEALSLLADHLMQVHIKDARPSGAPDTDWGDEVPAGTGDVDWPAFFAILDRAGYTGPLVIEREAGQQRETDIRTAKTFLLDLASRG